jgi:hypothetical protein
MLLKPNKPANQISSYRPISLTRSIAKCLEKIKNNRLTKYLHRKHKISVYQSGFRDGHCTKDHILRLSQSIKNGFNRNQYTGSVMFDMEKAFDRVWHDGLIFKIKQLNIPSYIIYWTKQFITNRTFYIQFNHTH